MKEQKVKTILKIPKIMLLLFKKQCSPISVIPSNKFNDHINASPETKGMARSKVDQGVEILS